MKRSTIFLSAVSLCGGTPTLTGWNTGWNTNNDFIENEIENKHAEFGLNNVQSQYTLGNSQYQQLQNQYVPNTNTQSQQYSQSCSASQCTNHEQRLLLIEAKLRLLERTIEGRSGLIVLQENENDRSHQWEINPECETVRIISVMLNLDDFDKININDKEYSGCMAVDQAVNGLFKVGFISDGRVTKSAFVLAWACVV